MGELQTDSAPKKNQSRRNHPRVTISDVSHAMGLSKSTVSRALNDYPDISEATKKRVSIAATRLGYRPSPQAQSLTTGLARSVALILSVTGDSVQKASLPELLDGLSWRLGQDNWTLTVATAAGDDNDLALYRRLISERKVDGFILPRTRNNDPRIDLLRAENVPFVLYGRTREPDGCSWFDFAGERAMRKAVERLAGFGHDRIAFIGTEDKYFMAGLRHQGFLNGMVTRGLNPDPALIRSGAMTADAGAEITRELLALASPPTAIVCAMDAVALGACSVIRDAGLKIGEDVSVIAYDGIPEGAITKPGLTTFASDSRDAGVNLADLLMRRLRGEPVENLRLVKDAEFVARKSDGPPRISPRELAERLTAGAITTQGGKNQ